MPLRVASLWVADSQSFAKKPCQLGAEKLSRVLIVVDEIRSGTPATFEMALQHLWQVEASILNQRSATESQRVVAAHLSLCSS